MRTSNPALKENTFTGTRAAAGEPAMTLQGTATKSLVLILLTVFSASFTWNAVASGNVGILLPATLVGGIGGLIVAMITIFKPRASPYTAPIYAALEGLLLGGISSMYNQRFAGLPLQAVALTFGVFMALLIVYRTGLIRATENFRLGVVAATGGIAIMYLLSFVLGFFGVRMSFLHDSSPLSIGISLVIVVVAALNLVLDFDFIERGVEHRAPKFMEWYAAFGLLVTLVWLYLELLRLLSKLQGRRN
ncbi:MAG TPA: Bax inhibitor-1/YccA family protein [Gemmatimonadaceae bacterium]|nr:Bax inhibitor-1/YccA family protein [Gemmatimonadaceae bacterium]